MEQCLHCQNILTLKPLSDEAFTCCWDYGERAGDINLRTGVSPAIEKYGLRGVPCERFNGGISYFPSSIKEDGERFLRNIFGIEG